MKRLVRWLFRTVAAVVVILGLFLSVITVFRIPVDLTPFKEPVELILSRALDRSVAIEKNISISTSLEPVFTLRGLRIGNPRSFTAADFLYMDVAQIKLKLLPFLQRKVFLPEISVQGLDITLEENESGDVNWIFNRDPAGAEGAETTKPPDASVGESGDHANRETRSIESDTLVVERLHLQDISVQYSSQVTDSPVGFEIESCVGTMVPGRPLNLDMRGVLQSFAYTAKFSIASLDEFLTENRSWVEVTADIAETELKLSGHVNLETAARSLALRASAKGNSLASLNDLLQLDLPPFAAYQLDADLSLQPKVVQLDKLFVKTGDSSLEGTARAVENENEFSVDLRLHSPVIQIDDFVFDEWSWRSDEIEEEVPQNQEKNTASEYKKLFAPDYLKRVDGSLFVEAEQVLSGADVLGSGKVNASLQDGRIAVAPLVIGLPGGKIIMSASLQPGKDRSDAELDVEMTNFDIGIYVRRHNPDSEMGGLVNLDVKLQSSAASLPELLENGSGYFDFSGKLENFRSGIVDLWAVNLVAALVASTDKQQSRINCAVGRWTVDNGLLSSDAFFVDTSKIRICAEGEVSLKGSRVDLKVRPRAKRAEFFSLATPVEIHGTFSDLNVGLGGAGVLGTAVQFITSPVITPLKRLFSRRLPSNGRDVCNMEIGEIDRVNIFVPGCNREPTGELGQDHD